MMGTYMYHIQNMGWLWDKIKNILNELTIFKINLTLLIDTIK